MFLLVFWLLNLVPILLKCKIHQSLTQAVGAYLMKVFPCNLLNVITYKIIKWISYFLWNFFYWWTDFQHTLCLKMVFVLHELRMGKEIMYEVLVIPLISMKDKMQFNSICHNIHKSGNTFCISVNSTIIQVLNLNMNTY